MANARKAFLKIIDTRPDDCCKVKGLIPEDKCGVFPRRSTLDGRLACRCVRASSASRRHTIYRTCQFYDGMKACLRNDSGNCGGEFNVEKGLHQGCVLSLLLFNIAFSAVLLVPLQRFREDSDILTDLLHFQEQAVKVSPETAMECVCRAMGRVLYADDACFVSR